MNIYKISQSANKGYDTYDSAIVAAENKEDAKNIHPSEFVTHISNGKWMGTYSGGANVGGEYATGNHEWVSYADRNEISVEFIGIVVGDIKRGVILASFNAG